MSEDGGTRYYAAVVASGLSVLGWLGALLGAAYTAYAFLFGSSAETAALLTGVALAVGIGFARVEKALYRSDERWF
jgi:hypothetical protein